MLWFHDAQVVEKNRKAPPKVRCLSSIWKPLGRRLGRRSRASFARLDQGIKKQILVGLGKDILSAISSKKYPSIFRVRGVGK
jgi:hypothetical protein